MFIDLISGRRSIRKYTSEKIEPGKIAKLVEAALRAPSSRGCNPWSFIVVEDTNLLKELAAAKSSGSSFLDKATLGIVVCVDPGTSDVWIEDGAIASVFVHVAAHSLGLASCWIQIRERMHSDSLKSRDYVAEKLGIPDGTEVLAIIAIGHGAQELPGHPESSLEYSKVFSDRFGQPWKA
jgi:nitroreductase